RAKCYLGSNSRNRHYQVIRVIFSAHRTTRSMRFRSSFLVATPIFGSGKLLRRKFYHYQTSHTAGRYMK
ncbi:hypothetical protein KKG37_00240, partial [Patescibacteria group bacterium]|nr:hypothetical protein [Patescibacteria group bacterium]